MDTIYAHLQDDRYNLKDDRCNLKDDRFINYQYFQAEQNLQIGLGAVVVYQV